MSPSDSGTDYDSNLGIPGSLTDTTDSPRSSEPPYERRRMMDAVNRLRATRRAVGPPGKTTTHRTHTGIPLPDTTDAPVGLSDPQFVAQRRSMLDTVNRLRATGAHLELDVPMIAVLGSQSAGKSSLIEAISGITLPLTERIRRAQCAILNPDTPNTFFLEAPLNVLEERHLSFSSNSVCLEISGRDVEDLTFIDLPGLIVGGEPHDATQVQALAEEYISRESCIILLTIACETDFENQSAHLLAARFDPRGARTIGVLTKPDRIPTGEEAIWISKIQSGDEDGGIEYYSVKNPDSQDIRNGITYERAREKEADFFSTKAPWSTLEWLYKRRLGTDKLTRRLGQVLSDLISKRLPELQGELDRLLEQLNDDISRLPNPPTAEPAVEIMKLIGTFVRSIEHIVAGAPDDNGLIQVLRGPREKFKKEIRQTAPDFRPLERPRDVSSAPTLPEPSFLSNEEPSQSGSPLVPIELFLSTTS
ncbi:P-loop containing nucleoside triphosphate hydrolase protein [Russula vinacea]|nr:P-loop containing nucleoside triphosphate hydrolase protein [Russula vinacea]